MTTSKLLNIPKVRFREPERNLPGRRQGVITAEARFTIQFAKSYIEQHMAIHHRSKKNKIICARQIAINRFGIADMVSISWSLNRTRKKSLYTTDEFLNIFSPTIRAFEIKLNNWRKGMMQAHRYRYFTNASVLVLPIDRNTNALEHIETFRKIHVGLWSFDIVSKRILTHYTPRPSSGLEVKYMKRVIQIIAGTSRALPVARK